MIGAGLSRSPRHSSGVHGQAETQRQVGTWLCMLMQLYGLCSEVKHRRETWEWKKAGQRANGETDKIYI